MLKNAFVIFFLVNVVATGASAQQDEAFERVLLCAIGAGIEIDADIEGSLETILSGTETEGNAKVSMGAPEFLNNFPEDQRAAAYELYTRCLFEQQSRVQEQTGSILSAVSIGLNEQFIQQEFGVPHSFVCGRPVYETDTSRTVLFVDDGLLTGFRTVFKPEPVLPLSVRSKAIHLARNNFSFIAATMERDFDFPCGFFGNIGNAGGAFGLECSTIGLDNASRSPRQNQMEDLVRFGYGFEWGDPTTSDIQRLLDQNSDAFALADTPTLQLWREIDPSLQQEIDRIPDRFVGQKWLLLQDSEALHSQQESWLGHFGDIFPNFIEVGMINYDC